MYYQTNDTHDSIGKKPIRFHIDKFIEQFNMANTYIGHNVSSDISKIRKEVDKILETTPIIEPSNEKDDGVVVSLTDTLSFRFANWTNLLLFLF